MRFFFDFLHFRIGCVLEVRHISNIEVVGYSNRCMDGLYIPFLDYDTTKYERAWIIEELRALMFEFSLNDFYVLQTENGFHAVSFDKLTLKRYIELLNRSSCDYNFKTVPIKYGKIVWNLRLTSKHRKPFIVQKLYGGYHIHSRSKAHIKMFEKIFKYKISDKENLDNSNKLILCRYNS